MSSSRPPEFPRVYDICPTCGYDHDFDLPRLPSPAREEATLAHLKAEGHTTDAPQTRRLVAGGANGGR